MIWNYLPLQCLTGLTWVTSAPNLGDSAAFDDNETNNTALLWADSVCVGSGSKLLSTLALLSPVMGSHHEAHMSQMALIYSHQQVSFL